jgi:aspartate kinase
MTGKIVCKFGGSSVADSGQIQKVFDIVSADPRRMYVVVSGPGRSRAVDEKVTDHLLNVASNGAYFWEARKDISAEASKDAVIERFAKLIDDLGIDGAHVLDSLRTDLDTDLIGDRRTAFLASRGEHHNAFVIAAYFQKRGLPARVSLPEEFGLYVSDDFLDAQILDDAHHSVQRLTESGEVTVIPGFYGVTRGGEIAVFSRGGSDLTGGEIAYATNADIYENWTDVSGVFEADPRLIPEARAIPRLTFKEIRLLSSKGFNVFHLNAMLHCKKRKIPIHIRNTNDPDGPGTVVLNERVPEEGIVGLARLDNMAYIYIEKDALSEEVGFTAGLLKIFKDYRIQTYHYPTDKDDIAVLVDQEDLKGVINDLRRDIERNLKPDFMDVVYNISTITMVGLGLKNNSFPMVDAITTLGNEHIPITMIDQSPSQICFHIGVNQGVADKAYRLLYDQLIAGVR